MQVLGEMGDAILVSSRMLSVVGLLTIYVPHAKVKMTRLRVAQSRSSSRQMQGQCSVGQGLPPLHEARCGWVFLTVASNLEAAPGSPQRQHGSGPLVVSCGQYVQRAANVCQ